MLLAIDHWETEGPQDPDEMDERDLRRIGLQREHRFSEEHAADRNSVETPDQFAIAPGLHGVRVAALVEASYRHR